MRLIKAGLLVGATTMTLLTGVGAGPAAAATGPGFGQHVSGCAQPMGFSGTHNPGMHQGAHHWDGLPC